MNYIWNWKNSSTRHSVRSESYQWYQYSNWETINILYACRSTHCSNRSLYTWCMHVRVDQISKFKFPVTLKSKTIRRTFSSKWICILRTGSSIDYFITLKSPSASCALYVFKMLLTKTFFEELFNSTNLESVT